MKTHLQRFAAGGYRGAPMYGEPKKALCGVPLREGVQHSAVPSQVDCKVCRSNNDFTVYTAGWNAAQRIV